MDTSQPTDQPSWVLNNNPLLCSLHFWRLGIGSKYLAGMAGATAPDWDPTIKELEKVAEEVSTRLISVGTGETRVGVFLQFDLESHGYNNLKH